MPPSPGKIHSLPIKILYNLDSSSQSYVTVPPNTYSVYVHPNSFHSDLPAEEGPLGSCYLKAAARGICFASPECIPNSSSLDFSVYNLDPLLRPRAGRAFSASSPQATPMTDESMWTGKGFLSWALSEAGMGNTLVKGRLALDHEFSSASFNDQGGLEGLMVAAAARAGSNPNGGGDEGDRGWGLEVCLSLKMVNPEKKDEFRGRREFEDMLRRGTALAGVSSPAVSTPRQTLESFRRPSQQPAPPVPLRANGSVPSSLPPQPSSSNAPSSSSLRPLSSLKHRPSPQTTNSPTRTTSSSSHFQPNAVPSSSIPMSVSSSADAELPPPSRPSSTTPAINGHTASSLPPPSTSARVSNSSREVTPPPPPPRKSPPPSTPSREKLHALLRSDEKMSPGLAKQLAANPVLLRLLKAVPASAGALSSLAISTTVSTDDKPSPDDEAPTPTPSASASVRANKAETVEGCCNCGTMQSELWRTKNMKDGSKKKVCNACGLYFNKHKRMRPPELWGSNAHDDGAHVDKKSKHEIEHHTPVRSSPRLNRSTDHTHHPPVPPVAESPRKRQRSSKVPQPSPRMATRASTRHENDGANGSTTEGKALDFSESLFSPSTMFGTSPAQGLNGIGNGHQDAMSNILGAGMGDGEIDIEALLSQIASHDTSGSGGFSLDVLFANASADGAGGGGGEGNGGESIMDLLTAWEGDVSNMTGTVGQGNGEE